MHAKVFWLVGVGVIVALVGWSASQAWADELQTTEVEMAPTSLALIGTIVAVTPDSRTLVVDVPLERDVLRVGALVTDTTTITKAGTATTLDSLQPGARVRIDVRRISEGNEAVAVEVLSGTSG